MFNTARVEALELDNLIEVARASMVSAEARKESRGAHDRADHPQPRRRQLAQAHALVQGGRPARLQAGAPEAAVRADDRAKGSRRTERTYPRQSLGKRMRFRVFRYDPDKDAKPYMQDYDVAARAAPTACCSTRWCASRSRTTRSSLRRSCREGVCGSDAMNINGKNGLACITKLADLKEPVELRPLPGLPVIRDLIVDMTQFFKQYHSIKPYLINDEPPPEKERLQSPEERDELERPVRMHPVRLLLDRLPVVLVEPGQVRRPGGPAAGLPLHRRQPRPGHQRAARQSGRPVPAVPLPHHHELRRRLPEGPQSDRGHRQDQDADGQAAV